MIQKKNQTPDREAQEFDEKVIQINRVSKKTKGGNKMGFSALMVVGDKKGRVGVGLGKAADVISAIRKGVKKAKKKMIDVPLDGTTIPFAITVKKGAGRVMLKPAPKGSGVIAGGPIRAVVEAAGVRDISSKIMGSDNQSSSVYATFEALIQIANIVKLKGIKLKSIAQIEAEEEKKLKEIQEKAKAKTEDKVEVKAKPEKKAEVKKPQQSVKKTIAKPTVKTETKTVEKEAVKPAKKVVKKTAKQTQK